MWGGVVLYHLPRQKDATYALMILTRALVFVLLVIDKQYGATSEHRVFEPTLGCRSC